MLARVATHELPKPYLYAEHLHFISDILVRLHNREDGFPRRAMFMAPPRHGKSELISHWFPTWEIAIDPSTKVIETSYELEQAARWGRMVRRSVTELYPLLGTRIIEDSRAAHRWDTNRGGGMVSAGVRGPITGKGASTLICDDPIKNAEEASSQVIRDSVWEWWTTTFLSREQKTDFDRLDPIIVLIMTRWHEDDLAGRILNSPEARLWHVVNLPALALERDELGRPPGAALWPDQFDALALEQKRAEMGSRAFQALYQGDPQPPGGIAIQRSWWRYFDQMPELSDFDQFVISCDPTFKGNADSDYVGLGVLGRKGPNFYLLDCIHKQMNGPATMKAIADLDAKWPQARWLLIEDTASGSMICDILEKERGHVIRGKHRSRAKEVRLSWQVNGAAALIERGAVYLPQDAPWAKKLVDEGAAFPHGKHDDLLDMLVQGLEHLLPRAWSHEAKSKREALDAPPKDYKEQLDRQLWAKIKERIRLGRVDSRKIQFPGL